LGGAPRRRMSSPLRLWRWRTSEWASSHPRAARRGEPRSPGKAPSPQGSSALPHRPMISRTGAQPLTPARCGRAGQCPALPASPSSTVTRRQAW
jgi:hypothetical protein